MAKIKNPKIKIIPVSSLEEANAALREIVKKEHAIEKELLELSEKAARLKEKSEEYLKPFYEGIIARVGGLEAFALDNKKELFDKPRSQKLAFGVIGFNKSTELKTLTKWNWGKVLEKLKELKKHKFIRTKQEIDKEALRGMTDEKLEEVGCRMAPKDVFYYETDREALGAGSDH